MEQAFRDIIQPVLERSCVIPLITIKYLTLKDFNIEVGLSKVRRAVLQTVQQLEGYLALVASKERIRLSIGSQLRMVTGPAVVVNQKLTELSAKAFYAANLDLGCAFISTCERQSCKRFG